VLGSGTVLVSDKVKLTFVASVNNQS
jgi:hypothetical protein